MDCPVCRKILIIEDMIVAEYLRCEQCDYEKVDYSTNGKCCISPNVIAVRVYWDETEANQDSEKYSVYNQCQNCGKRIGTARGNKNFKKNDLPQSRTDLAGKIKVNQDKLSEISKRINDRKRQSNQIDFWHDYNGYLNSERWKEIAKIVSKRDNHLCQSCLCEKATMVHHTVGRYRKNEPLFTLFSVCSRCHDIITEIDRGNHDKVEKISYAFDKNE